MMIQRRNCGVNANGSSKDLHALCSVEGLDKIMPIMGSNLLPGKI